MGSLSPKEKLFFLVATDTITNLNSINVKGLFQVVVLEGDLIQRNLEGIGISFPFPFFLIAFGVPNPDTNYRITVEYYSESGPSLN
jgi:hypothetical protein